MLTASCQGEAVPPITRHDHDTVLCESDLNALRLLVETLEPRYDITVLKSPGVCLTLIRAEDSLERQEFYLGEALTQHAQSGYLLLGLILQVGVEGHDLHDAAIVA